MVGSAPDTLRFLECMRKGGAPILPAELARAAMTNQIGALAGPMPGFGFRYGGAVLLDPQAAQATTRCGRCRCKTLEQFTRLIGINPCPQS
jgi:hypothetical protein